jgi:hypothetical protein
MLRRLLNLRGILDRTPIKAKDLRRLVSAVVWMRRMMAALPEAEACMHGCIAGRGLVLDRALILDLGRGSDQAAAVE